MRKELSVANDKLKSNLRGAEENLKHRLEQEKDLLLLDQYQDRGFYQKLLKEFHELEQHAEMLEQKLALHVPEHSRSLSYASSSSGQVVSTELPQDDQNIVKFHLNTFIMTIIKKKKYTMQRNIFFFLLFKGLWLWIHSFNSIIVNAIFTRRNDRLESITIEYPT